MVFCFKTRLKLFVLWIKLLLMGMIVLFFAWFIIQRIKLLITFLLYYLVGNNLVIIFLPPLS